MESFFLVSLFLFFPFFLRDSPLLSYQTRFRNGSRLCLYTRAWELFQGRDVSFLSFFFFQFRSNHHRENFPNVSHMFGIRRV